MKRFIVYSALLLVAAAVVVGQRTGAWAAVTELTTNPFDAWGWIGVPADQTAASEGVRTDSALGFLHLNCNSDPDLCSAEGLPNVTVDPETGAVSGWAWFGSSADSDSAGYPIGWVDFDPDPLASGTYAAPACNDLADPIKLYPAAPCNAASLSLDNSEEVYGWARIISLAQAGDTELGTSNFNNDWGWVLLRGQTSAGDLYGTLYRDGTFDGWAYSGGGTLADGSYDTSVGFGWLSFAAASTGSTTGPTGKGYVATEQGDVYLANGISNPDGTLSPDQAQATYLLLGSADTGASFVNFSQSADSDRDGDGQPDGIFSADDFADITLPQSSTEYRSELGRLDLGKMTTIVSDGKNVYGNPVVTYNTLSDFIAAESQASSTGASVRLDNRIIHITQDSTLSQSLTFLNGVLADSSGAGTIIIRGNLSVQANSFYQGGSVDQVRKLASVAWFVQGDITIHSTVSNMVGAYFALPSGGRGGTITTQDASQTQLQVLGLMMANQFVLQRTYEGLSGSDEPAELFYYDGRAVTNPPPGFTDIAANLPRITN